MVTIQIMSSNIEINGIDVEPSKKLYESSDDEGPISKNKNRIQKFSDSGSDVDFEHNSNNEVSVTKTSFSKSRTWKILTLDDDSDIESKHASPLDSVVSSDEDNSNIMITKKSGRSRIRKLSDNDDSSTDTVNEPIEKEQQLRLKNKNKKLRDKFKNLLNSRDKEKEPEKKEFEEKNREHSLNRSSDESENYVSSIDKIKKKIHERSAALKMTICDPDTSDEESKQYKSTYTPKVNKVQRKTKLTSPKPQRISAKQAMENMQKIKSESNRMLREKEVSLPYHRPKALSLHDIMKRRRPAVSSDDKALPIKMNEQQLKEYVLLLETRQKEMMELCKSESEEEAPEQNAFKDSSDMNSLDVNEASKEIAEKVTELPNATNEIAHIMNKNVDDDIYKNVEHCIKEASTALETNTNHDSIMEDLNRSGDISTEMKLVYNDSIEETNAINDIKKDVSKVLSEDNSINPETCNFPVISNINDISKSDSSKDIDEVCNENKKNYTICNTEEQSQLISLQYNSEQTEQFEINKQEEIYIVTKDNKIGNKRGEVIMINPEEETEIDDFPDDDIDMDNINMDNIDSIIENTEIIKNTNDAGSMNSPALVRDISILNTKPKLTGAPGMLIDLDGTDPVAPKKLTGVELLKERFTFFSKLRTPEEMEREREKKQKPGTQHLKLKHELEEIIAEQRSLEWSKRLESEKQQQKELDAIIGDGSDAEDDIDKAEAKLSKKEEEKETSSESEEEDLLEDDVLIEDKQKKMNPLVADEAEESGLDETKEYDKDIGESDNEDIDNDEADANDQSEEDSSEEDESSESEDEQESRPKKSRILKAFEDSDDENSSKLDEKKTTSTNIETDAEMKSGDVTNTVSPSQKDVLTESQDDVIQLAQVEKQVSSDVFTSQDTAHPNTQGNTTLNNSKDDEELATQSFSILNATKIVKAIDDPDKLTVIPDDTDKFTIVPEDLGQLTIMSETQPYNDDNLDAVVDMCSGSFRTQNCIVVPPLTTQMSQSQDIGDDILQMCTGKFYDNQFVSPNDGKLNTSDELSPDPTLIPEMDEKKEEEIQISVPKTNLNREKENQEEVLQMVLAELNEPDFGSDKPLKFFSDGKSQNKENENEDIMQVKKKFVIDSDEETNYNDITLQKKKKYKKKKLEKRALQISDDEEDDDEPIEEDDYCSENEEDRLVEYDSEENEVEIKPHNVKKKKRKATEFFEQEAELTSEDEWVGSGDEDEAGLDRMEREEGDDETFHQEQLQRELGQIHMRDVLDQDKREVRLIQELLFEDGDLGGGGRQRKFRWRNADGEEVSGTIPEEWADTQEEEFESEEQWRKQRHEREMFLRQMKNDEKDDLNVSVNRTSIIKANLCSRTMSSLLEEVNQEKIEAPKTAVSLEKKTTKDIPSPVKKPFTMFQQNYHGSLLTRGQGALARLAALATPLAADDDAPKIGLLAPSSKRNFVFTAVTKEETEPKVIKRKAESSVGTPRLVKKMKTEEKQNRPKSSLLEFLKT